MPTRDDEDPLARERMFAEIREAEELTWPGWGPNGDKFLYFRVDEGVAVLFECTRCHCVVTSCTGHEEAMHPDEPWRVRGPLGRVRD